MGPNQELDAIDPEALNHRFNKYNVGSQVSNYGIPVNITFSEPSFNYNIKEQLQNRRYLAEYCFEGLNCNSISFVKQSSVHLYSDAKYNGVVVDLGAEFTQISPVFDGYTSMLSSSLFKVTGNKLDRYFFSRLHNNFCITDSKPSMDILSLYKIKFDLKETIFSPYRIPFNYEMLK